ncbi:TDP2 [Branchiostoma lanceolatum]|uniref:Tyrosyl-DNA phosphodiesterase 2 n=1 Tax=Branchiostoma lanceolatum TaxID=7740 RepID=A0A8J9ZCB7_BRALA|nr:TDP2 [Branchiostoma lanceolatum]
MESAPSAHGPSGGATSGQDPGPQERRQLQLEFSEITGSSLDQARFYLLKNGWRLQDAINDYFEPSEEEETGASPGDQAAAPASTLETSQDVCIISEQDPDIATGSEQATRTGDSQSVPVTTGLNLLTWNIDGLDQRNITERTKTVCNTINSLYPDVVFLQEVIPQTFAYIEAKCDRYKSIASGTEQYFTAMLLRKSSITFLSQHIQPFPTTQMMRNLLIVHARFGRVPLSLMTTHLESTKDHAAERKRQLRQVLQEVEKQDQSNTVIVGGDLNLRDAEVVAVGGLPAATVDFWEAVGSPWRHKFTWDVTKNDNLDWDLPFRPKCRFDRVYVRSSHPDQLAPENITFVGTDRLEGCGRFPSDHWGLLCKFVKPSVQQDQGQVEQRNISDSKTGSSAKRARTS